MSRDLYIYGMGGHAKVVAATARLCGWRIGGFFADNIPGGGAEFFGSPVVAFDSIPDGASVFIAFGDNEVRYRKGRLFRERFSMPAIIHPTAVIATSAEIGCGTYVGAMANVDPDCRIGDFCIINKLTNISHDSVIGDGTHCSVGSLIAGNVTVGERCCIGIGSRIIEKIRVGDDAVIGGGAVVIRDIPDAVTAVGCPARIIRTRDGK